MRHRLIAFLTLAISTMIVYAQNDNTEITKEAEVKTPQPQVVVQKNSDINFHSIDSLMKAYCFDKAYSQINAEIKKAKENGINTRRLERLASQAKKGATMIQATEKVNIIDSIVVKREDFLNAFSLDSTCGKLLSAESVKKFFNTSLASSSTGFLNNFGDQIIFSQAGEGATSSLVYSNKYNNQWTAPTPLPGLEDANAQQGYPFLMSDGITLYFAANDKNSLGGYDIYITRYNSDKGVYYKPENMGMPFNSPSNDYLMVYDDANELGWFVSDRNQPVDKVCIYVFVPTSSRDVYEGLDSEQMRSLAALRSIKGTQLDEQKVAEAQQRLAFVRSQKKDTKLDKSFVFDIAYGKRYISLSQFKNAEARKLCEQWLISKNNCENLQTTLNQNRQKYAKGSAAEKNSLTTIILKQEADLETYKNQLAVLANQIRNLEK